MSTIKTFIAAIKSEFPDDRLTYQKAIPTFHPESANEAAALIKLANQHHQKLFVTGFGNIIDPVGQAFDNIVSIRTDRLNQLVEIVPDDFYVKLGAGYPLHELNSHLAGEKLWLPHAALPYVGSVGGAVAGGLSVDLHDHDLPLKKYLIQAEVVTPEGEIVTPGSVCFKSVSGYDVVKLYAGSWGLLGMIITATFRVMPESGQPDFASMKMKAIDRNSFLAGLDDANDSPDAIYSRKIKAKFDPNGIFPVV